MNMTKHAEKRAHQRAVPPIVIQWLQDYGHTEYDNSGSVICYFDKKSRRQLKREIGDMVVNRLNDLLDTYIVMKEETVITVGHRYKRIKRH